MKNDFDGLIHWLDTTEGRGGGTVCLKIQQYKPPKLKCKEKKEEQNLQQQWDKTIMSYTWGRYNICVRGIHLYEIQEKAKLEWLKADWFPPVFSCSFTFTFRSVTHFDLIFMYGMKKRLKINFYNIGISFQGDLEKVFLFPLHYFGNQHQDLFLVSILFYWFIYQYLCPHNFQMGRNR